MEMLRGSCRQRWSKGPAAAVNATDRSVLLGLLAFAAGRRAS
jgi:hypothetical protein